jgi:hypothetical protein
MLCPVESREFLKRGSVLITEIQYKKEDSNCRFYILELQFVKCVDLTDSEEEDVAEVPVVKTAETVEVAKEVSKKVNTAEAGQETKNDKTAEIHTAELKTAKSAEAGKKMKKVKATGIKTAKSVEALERMRKAIEVKEWEVHKKKKAASDLVPVEVCEENDHTFYLVAVEAKIISEGFSSLVAEIKVGGKIFSHLLVMVQKSCLEFLSLNVLFQYR